MSSDYTLSETLMNISAEDLDTCADSELESLVEDTIRSITGREDFEIDELQKAILGERAQEARARLAAIRNLALADMLNDSPYRRTERVFEINLFEYSAAPPEGADHTNANLYHADDLFNLLCNLYEGTEIEATIGPHEVVIAEIGEDGETIMPDGRKVYLRDDQPGESRVHDLFEEALNKSYGSGDLTLIAAVDSMCSQTGIDPNAVREEELRMREAVEMGLRDLNGTLNTVFSSVGKDSIAALEEAQTTIQEMRAQNRYTRGELRQQMIDSGYTWDIESADVTHRLHGMSLDLTRKLIDENLYTRLASACAGLKSHMSAAEIAGLPSDLLPLFDSNFYKGRTRRLSRKDLNDNLGAPRAPKTEGNMSDSEKQSRDIQQEAARQSREVGPMPTPEPAPAAPASQPAPQGSPEPAEPAPTPEPASAATEPEAPAREEGRMSDTESMREALYGSINAVRESAQEERQKLRAHYDGKRKWTCGYIAATGLAATIGLASVAYFGNLKVSELDAKVTNESASRERQYSALNETLEEGLAPVVSNTAAISSLESSLTTKSEGFAADIARIDSSVTGAALERSAYQRRLQAMEAAQAQYGAHMETVRQGIANINSAVTDIKNAYDRAPTAGARTTPAPVHAPAPRPAAPTSRPTTRPASRPASTPSSPFSDDMYDGLDPAWTGRRK